jgi:hypothetical protein
MAPEMDKVGPRGAQSPADYLTRLEQANVANSIANLMTFPRLRKMIERGDIGVHGAFFGVATGKLSVLDQATGTFTQIAEEDHARLFAAPRFYAAFFLAWISLRLIRLSAIWIALSAAPLRRLSDTIHSTSPLSTVGSVRMRLI